MINITSCSCVISDKKTNICLINVLWTVKSHCTYAIKENTNILIECATSASNYIH